MERNCENAQKRKIYNDYSTFSKQSTQNAPWYIRTSDLHRDLGVSEIMNMISFYSSS